MMSGRDVRVTVRPADWLESMYGLPSTAGDTETLLPQWLESIEGIGPGEGPEVACVRVPPGSVA